MFGRKDPRPAPPAGASHPRKNGAPHTRLTVVGDGATVYLIDDNRAGQTAAS